MTRSEEIINYLKGKEYIKLDWSLIEEAPEFLEEIRINNINSFLLESKGHKPETSINYSKVAFHEWCYLNNIEAQYDARDRIYFLKHKLPTT